MKKLLSIILFIGLCSIITDTVYALNFKIVNMDDAARNITNLELRRQDTGVKIPEPSDFTLDISATKSLPLPSDFTTSSQFTYYFQAQVTNDPNAPIYTVAGSATSGKYQLAYVSINNTTILILERIS